MSASRSSAAPNSSSMRALVRSSFQSVNAVTAASSATTKKKAAR